jgi:septal ring factor EnvC (AmiA/AmiB activator)
MRRAPAIALALMMLTAASAALRAQQKTDYLTDDEQDKVREAQDPSERIKLYVAIAQSRLDRFEKFRTQPRDDRYDNGGYMDKLLSQYISVDDEMKDWIEDQFDRNGDMRQGLRALLDAGPKQLEELRRLQQTPDPLSADYGGSLKDAIADLTDTLDGATQALADQEKKFGALKKEEKAEAQANKQRLKEEKKRTKEEKKLRKKEHKSGVPGDSDVN